MKPHDDNDLLRAGKLPDDPFDAPPIDADAAVNSRADERAGEESVETTSTVGRVEGEQLAAHWRTVREHGKGRSWFTTRPPPRRWLLSVPANKASGADERGAFPLGKVGMLVAGGGAGKTMALAQLALAVATGRPWLAGSNGEGGFLVPSEGGRVLLALAEEDAEEVQRRLFHAVELARRTGRLTDEEANAAEDRIVVLALAGEPVFLVSRDNDRGREITPSTLANEITKRLADGGPWALVILDPLSRFSGSDTETDNAAATRFVQILETFVRAPGGPAVLVAHHNTKAARRENNRDGTGARGSSALIDGVRWVAELSDCARPEGAPPDLARLAAFEITKNNYAPRLDATLWLARDEQHGGALRAATAAERQGLDAAKAEAVAKTRKEQVRKQAPNETERIAGERASEPNEWDES